MLKTWKTVLKTVSWRIIGAADTFAIAFFVTGKPVSAAGLVGLEVITKSIWYYVHEKVWDHAAAEREMS